MTEVSVEKRRIFTVGMSLPGDEFEHIEFNSNQTLLDADIIIVEPTFGDFIDEYDYRSSGSRLHSGIPILTEHSSFEVNTQLVHWRSEIIAAVNAGKLVIVHLAAPIERYRYTGEKTYSGSGKSRVATSIVAPISSYEAIPNLKKVTAKLGASIRLEKDAGYLKSYWNEFSKDSRYEVEIEGEFSDILLRSHAGNRIVGAAFYGNAGALLFLPPLRYNEEVFLRDAEEGEDDAGEYWTEDALKYGKRLVAHLVGLAAGFKKSSQFTPPPSWALTSTYRLNRESELESMISICTSEIAKLQVKKTKLERQLEEVGELRRLLFEQGKPLERIIIEAMKILGFDAKSFSSSESEFDIVFVSGEARCLGEAEGKDNKSINIDKFSQLERNIHEDFARDDVNEHAKGVLFGNAFRLTPIESRSDFFTEKCVSAAKRVGASLVRTPDLFAPVKYLKENPFDTKYAAECREAIITASGSIVVFPTHPDSGVASLTENAALNDVGLDVERPDVV